MRFKFNDFNGAMAVVVTSFRYGFAEAVVMDALNISKGRKNII